MSHITPKRTYTFHSRLGNWTNTKFTEEQINTLILGFNYAVGRDQKYDVIDFMIDTENGIRQLDNKMQNTCQYLAKKKIKKS